jgi:iduronate 2-sulfatase|tara:strand:+ start:23655 stop:23948 length:294 start_codon:yes stop_codon:yes gene_type:complete
LFPIVCELVEIAKPKSLDGTSLLPQVSDAAAAGRNAVSYNSKASTIRTTTHRLIFHKGGTVELYDHTTPEGETKNLAASGPELVSELKAQLAKRLGK